MSRNKPTIPRNRQPCDLPSEVSTDSFWHSEPSALLTAHRSTRKLPQYADVLIIGSGMSGTSVAHHLLSSEDGGQTSSDANGKNRPNVVMLEAREACWGATGRNGGHCQPILFEHPHNPGIGHFELANYHTIKSLVETKNIDCEFVSQPGVRAIYDKSNLTEVELSLLTVQETAPELASMMRLVTDKAELDKLRIPTAVGAVVTSVAARMWPYKFVARILEELLTSTKLNGTFNLQTLTPVESISSYDVGARWTVKTARGSIVASKLVVATNAYTSHILPNFADLIVPCIGQMSALEPLSGVRNERRLKTSFGFMGQGVDDYLIQRPDERGGHLMFGGGRQHAKSMGSTDDSHFDEKTAQYLRTRLIDALNPPKTKTRRREPPLQFTCDRCKSKMIKCVQEVAYEPCKCCTRLGQSCTYIATGSRAKKMEFKAAYEWTGIMGFSRDDVPWVGPLPNKRNLYITAGFTGHGMPNTWLCGKAVALMVQKTLDLPFQGVPLSDDDGELQNLDAEFNAMAARAVDDVVKQIGLPECYLVTAERIEKALELEDVEARDWAEMERGRRRMEADRPHSGYA